MEWRTNSRRSVGGSNSVAIWTSLNCCRRIADVSLHLEAGRPANPGQGVDQRAALNAESAADRSLGRTTVERCHHRGKLFAIDRNRAPTSPAAAPAAAPGRGEAGPDPLLGQRPLELRQGAENMK